MRVIINKADCRYKNVGYHDDLCFKLIRNHIKTAVDCYFARAMQHENPF